MEIFLKGVNLRPFSPIRIRGFNTFRIRFIRLGILTYTYNTKRMQLNMEITKNGNIDMRWKNRTQYR